jgi:hypothetical protein
MSRVPACLCEGCSLIAPLEDFVIDAIGYVISRVVPGREHIGLRCPRCGSDTISEGDTEAPTAQELKLSKLRYALYALDVTDELKQLALESLERPDDEWGQELRQLAELTFSCARKAA